jgi:hypothetical protein
MTGEFGPNARLTTCSNLPTQPAIRRHWRRAAIAKLRPVPGWWLSSVVRYADRTNALAIGLRVRVVDAKQDWYGLAPGCKEQERKQVVAVPAGSRDYCSGKKPDDVLFPMMDARKTLAWINAQAKTNVQGHGLRATSASIAEELMSSAALKRMLNHAVGADVTLGHYVGKSEGQLRAGWQTVADFIDAATMLSTAHDGVPSGSSMSA